MKQIKFLSAFVILFALTGCFESKKEDQPSVSTPAITDALQAAGCSVQTLSNGKRITCNSTTADWLTGSSGSNSGDEFRIISPTGDSSIQLLVAGPTSDLNNVTVSKTVWPSPLVITITRPSSNVKYISLKASFTAVESGNNTSAQVGFPETSGQTSIANSQRPVALRYVANSLANGTVTSTVANTSGQLDVNITGLTSNQQNSIHLMW